MLVSVVLPVYNGLPYLSEAIATILAQDIEFELIVSDDMSGDGSREVVRKLTDPRIRVLTNEANAGIFGNLNRCIAAATGQFIQVFSQDDLMKPGYLASQVRLLQKYPEAGLVYGAPECIDASGSLIASAGSDATPEFIGRDLYLWIGSHYGALPASISSIMIPRRTFETIGVFSPEFPVAGDIEFYNRVAERFPILRNVAVLHSIRTHQGMTSALSTTGPRYLRDELALEKWYRSRWNADDYRKIRRFRAVTRGRYHAAWIARLLRSGRIGEAAAALWRLHGLYPLPWVIWGCARSLLRPDWQPQPTVPPPRL
jgi:glycosyltransferase involved in cell wall biosynthesis